MSFTLLFTFLGFIHSSHYHPSFTMKLSSSLLVTVLFFLSNTLEGAEALTIVPRVLSKKETEQYRQQPHDDISTVLLDSGIVNRLQRAASFDMIMEREDATLSASLEMPVSYLPSGAANRRSQLKGLRKGDAEMKSLAYLTLDDIETKQGNIIDAGSLVVFASNENPRDVFTRETKVLGPWQISNKEKRHRRGLKGKSDGGDDDLATTSSSKSKSEKKTKKKEKDSSSRKTDAGFGPPTAYPSESASSLPSIAPSAAPSLKPTDVDATTLYYGPCVCYQEDQEACFICKGDGEDCFGDCS